MIMRSKSTKTTRHYYKNDTGRRIRFVVSGSFTVEAALLMTILIPVLTALIYAAFYIHDSAVLQGIVCELAVAGSNLSQEKNRAGELEKKKNALLSSRFTGTRGAEISIEAGNNSVSASGSGEFRFPGMIMNFFGGSIKRLSKSWSREILQPADLIRKIRGLEYMVDTIKE